LMGYALHKMPQIGELAPGYWLASAFGGHGLNTTAMAGDLIARAIVEGDDRWRLFSAYDLVWAGGRVGRAAAQAIIWSTQARDALKERIARYRDRARREAEERQARWAAEKAARKAEEKQRRADEEARRLAEEAARRAQEEAGRRAAEEARKAEEEAARVAAEKAVQDAVDAAFALPKQVEQYKPAAIAAAAADAPPLAETAPISAPDTGAVQAEVATVEPAAAAGVTATAEAAAAVGSIMAEPVPPAPAKSAGKRRSRGRKKKE
jgi:membrane protein involved in colicin uptake